MTEPSKKPLLLLGSTIYVDTRKEDPTLLFVVDLYMHGRPSSSRVNAFFHPSPFRRIFVFFGGTPPLLPLPIHCSFPSFPRHFALLHTHLIVRCCV